MWYFIHIILNLSFHSFFILIVLASLDLWRQYAINNDDYWFYNYAFGVKSSNDFWKLGFRIEDLEYKLQEQKSFLLQAKTEISALSSMFRATTEKYQRGRKARNIIHDLLRNDSSVYQIHCETSGPYLRVGQNDFRTDSRDSCQIFTGPTGGSTGPHTMFEAVPFNDGSFGLKSVSSGYYLKAVPPPMDSTSLPWKIVIGGPVAGTSERFFTTDDGYLYSPLMSTYAKYTYILFSYSIKHYFISFLV